MSAENGSPASENGAKPVLEARSVRRVYESHGQTTVALDSASLAIDAGELVAIEGRSGSGKTTLLNVLSGLDDADEGTVRLLGDELGDLSTDDRLDLRAGNVGFVFQDPALVPELTLLENVALSARIGGTTPDASRTRALEALDEVGLDGLEDRFPGEVSGGEAQRASVARAFAKRPRVVLADEPTANLDRETAKLVADVFDAYVTEDEGASLVVTHDEIMANAATRTYQLEDGRLCEGRG
jgi:putative ABC transport system ATP-binding protein